MEELVPPFYKADRSFGAEIASISGNVGAFLPSYLSNATAPWKIVSWNEVLKPFRDSWINVQKPLAAEHLDGRLVILNFFTYSCIDCVHVLPYLKRLESLFDEGSVRIVGVHSAKFTNEKSSINVTNAVSRYEIDHPVINDVDCLLWRKLGVQCWPAIVVVDPRGRLIFWFEGESRMSDLEDLIGRSLKYYRECGVVSSAASAKPTSSTGEVVRSSDGLQIGTPTSKAVQSSGLKFPGKVALSPSAQSLAISDSGHHRILICHLSLGAASCSSVVAVGQTGCSGSQDGAFSIAQFHSPQGLCWMDEETLFVADTENHLIRRIDMKHGMVSTVGGVGRQGQDLIGGKTGREQDISSPWDIVILETEPDNRSLLIAAAGTHQIWILPLMAAVIIGKRQYETNRLYCFAGSGRKAAKNNSYPHQAAFAQPSGLCINSVASSVLYVADSESSSIRVVDMKTGSVENVVGGDKNSENLHAFGDADGEGFAAKLQHPLAVAYCQQTGNVYIADTYNHKIKVIDAITGACRSLALDFDNVDPKTLNEPSGICVVYPNLYIVDTNNHRVLVVDMETLRVKQLEVAETTKMDLQGRSRAVPAGLRNLGNTCYMNSYLQTLFHLLPIRRVMYAWRRPPPNESTPDKRPADLVKVLKIDFSKQEDVQEFSMFLLDLVDQVIAERKGEEKLQSLFTGRCRSVVKCRSCKGESTSEDKFSDFGLQIADVLFIRDALEGYFAVTRIRKKLSHAVFFPAVLDLKPFLTKEQVDEWGDEGCCYELRAVLIHQGELDGGHYFARIRTAPDGQWYTFNDDRVKLHHFSERSPADAQGAYLLVYERRRDIEGSLGHFG